VANYECFVPIAELLAAPFLLSQGNLVKAQIQATNLVGSSAYSNPNLVGALIEIVPHQPAVAPSRDPSSTRSTFVINVQPMTGTLTGGGSIISYELQMNSGSGFASVAGGTP
jgi:hypothetical protein